MHTQRIEDTAAFEQFSARLGRNQFHDACNMLLTDGGLTVDQVTLERISTDAAREVGMFARSREAMLNRKILIPKLDRAPYLRGSGNARAVYQLRHWDMLTDFARALQALVEFQVCATRADITPELASWAAERAKDPGMHDRIARHFDLTEEKK